MPGFFDNISRSGMKNSFNKLSRMGMEYDDLLLKNSKAIGYIEGEMRRRTGATGSEMDLMDLSLSLADTTSKLRSKTLAFFQLDMVTKREKLRDIAANPEIEFVLDTIADDTITYDEHNRFCHPADIVDKITPRKGIVPLDSTENFKEKIRDSYLEVFDDIYSAWGFDSGITAWQYLIQFLTEGVLSFEIIYDNLEKPKNIIGFKEIDPSTLYPMTKKDERGEIFLVWLQRDDIASGYRELADSQIIYLAYSNIFKTKRMSFVERMIRSFNMLRLIEQSKVIWHIMYAAIRLKTTVPIGTKSMQKAKEDLREFANLFKEEIVFNNDSGELVVDGQPKMHYYKNYIIPSNDRGEKIDVESLEMTGPDLQDSQLLDYFFKKLKMDSKLPFSRWDYNEGGGSYLLGPDTVLREELRYDKMISRLRACMAELVTKPLYLQMCMRHESLKNDIKFKNAIGIKFHDDHTFQRMKDAEIMKKGAETVSALAQIKKDPESQLHVNFLMKKYMDLTEEDILANEKEWEQELINAKRHSKKAGGTGGKAQGGAPAEGGGAQTQAPAEGGGAQAQAPAEGGGAQVQAPAEGGEAQAGPLE